MLRYTTLLIIILISTSHAGFPEYYNEFLKFVCPYDFIQNGTDCFQKKTSNICPELKQLNTLYQIKLKRNDGFIKSNIENDSYCKYTQDEFFKTSENNTIHLNLILSYEEQLLKLYLNVTTKKPVNDMEKKINCLKNPGDNKIKLDKPIFQLISNNMNITRYSIKLDESFGVYSCYFVDPGKIKPAFSNYIAIDPHTHHLFKVEVNSLCFSRIRHENNFYAFTQNIMYGKSDKVSMYEAIADFKNQTFHYCNSSSTNITFSCTPKGIISGNRIFNSKLIVGEKKVGNVLINKSRFLNDICLGMDGKLFKMKCMKNGFDSQFIKHQKCSLIMPSNQTAFLLDIFHDNVTDLSLKNISEILNKENVNEYDVNLVANILSKAVMTSNHSEFFKAIDAVQNVNIDVLNSSMSFNSTDKILKSAEMVIEKLVEKEVNVSVSYPNVAYHIQPIFGEENQSDVIISIKDEKTNETVQVKLSQNLLKSFNLSQEVKQEPKISIVAFNTNKLFPGNIENKVVDITIYPKSEEHRRFKTPLTAIFRTTHTQVLCVFWDEISTNWSSNDTTTQRLNETAVECKTYHLTRFSLLIIDEEFVERNSTFEIIYTIEAGLSFISVCIILLLAIISKTFTTKRTKTVHLSFIILIEIILIWIVEYVPGLSPGFYCITLGISLHYIVLVKFTLTLLIVKTQLNNFVYFIGLKKLERCFSLSEIFTVWILPLFVIIISGVLSPDKYNSGSRKFCYPKDELFYYFVVLPIGIIILINLTALIWVLVNINETHKKNENLRSNNSMINFNKQFRLAVMLIFMLGIVWLFGVLATIFNHGILHTIFKYTYSFISPLQGFAIFIFSVCLERKGDCNRGFKKI